eukprot:TRINITY_DN5422_c0_g1_i2.p1 TRINITY_DN5422_c0_g1~~TRINITY_DN5422_c0_g1_i2.p1  ORF type:complete len:398 (-),score=136.28 TRINITY_DN5422_c0_g1_i2:458-1651(-)
MASSRFSSVSSRVAVDLTVTAVAAVSASTTIGASYKPAVGAECKCARIGTPGHCLALTSVDAADKVSGRCKPVAGANCPLPYACVNSAADATHVCIAQAMKRTLRCTDGAVSEQCDCAVEETEAVTLAPVQALSSPPDGGSARSGGGGKETPVEQPWAPAGPAPAPQEPACAATHVRVSVFGKPWTCVQSMDIGQRAVATATAYEGWDQHGWATVDDYINLNLLRDAAARLYLCVTYGSAATTGMESGRTASTTVTSAVANRLYAADDPAGGSDVYTPSVGTAAHTLMAANQWEDAMTDRFCVAAAEGLVLDFTALAWVKGLVLGKGSSVTYATGADGRLAAANVGGYTRWNMQQQSETQSLAYDGEGRVKGTQTKVHGRQMVAAIKQVKFEATCEC